MKTIGAKDLRLHLDEILDRVLQGEEIIISHRFKKPVKLSALYAEDTRKPKHLAGLAAFDAAHKHPSPFDDHKTIKELYRESIAKKYRH